jgi:outer membrane biosynthesis protein TonB
VPPGDPVVAGGLTTQEVQAVIRANLNQIRHCYEQLLQRSPNANGKIKVNFVIGSDGRVTSSNIASDTVGDAVMAGCVTGKIVRWKFPTPRGGQNVNVNYPFVFNPL